MSTYTRDIAPRTDTDNAMVMGIDTVKHMGMATRMTTYMSTLHKARAYQHTWQHA